MGAGLWGLVGWLVLATLGVAQAGPETREIADHAGNTLDVTVYPADGQRLYLWLLPQAGEHENHDRLARELVASGIEVWMVDLLDAYFLPRTNESMRSLDGQGVAALVREAHRETGKEVMLVASGRPAIVALRGMRQWQRDEPDSPYLIGATLAFPNLMIDTPVAGAPAEYVDEARATNLPVFILQPELGVYRWYLDEILGALRGGGSPVFVQMVPQVRDFYYLRRGDPSAEERAATDQLPRQLRRAGNLLATMPRPLAASPLPEREATVEARRGLVERDHAPPMEDFTLADHLGDEQSLSDYAGEVILLNFWATWCPPCVHEIPSMNRMAEKLGEGFGIVSVNYQESAEHIAEFMDEVQVDFPVLMDFDGRAEFMDEVQVDFPVLMDFDGRVAAAWRVFAFPSSFILDREGRIRYSVNSAIEWDDPEVIDTVRELMQ